MLRIFLIKTFTLNFNAYSNEKDENGEPKKLKLNNLNQNTLFADINTEFNSMHNILNKFFKKNRFINYDNKHLSIMRDEREGNYIFYGELNYGPFGTEHNVVNANNNELTEKKINKTESVVTPYYYYLRIFKNATDGLLILETKSNLGIKVIFEHWINQFLEEIKCTHFKIKIESFLPKEIIDKFSEESRIKKIRYISYQLPDDTIELFDDYEPNEGFTEYIINIKKGKSKPHKKFIKKILSKDINASKELMKNITFHTDAVKLELEIENEVRTFTIGQISKTRPIKDITYGLETEETGHRKFNSIHNIASKYAKDIIESNFN